MKYVIASIAILLSTPALALSPAEEAQLSRLHAKKAVELLGPARADATPFRMIRPGQYRPDHANCKTIEKRTARGIYRRTICPGHRPE